MTRDLISWSSGESVAKLGRWLISMSHGLSDESIMTSMPRISNAREPSALGALSASSAPGAPSAPARGGGGG